MALVQRPWKRASFLLLWVSQCLLVLDAAAVAVVVQTVSESL